MKVAIITVAGISSRFNEGIQEDKKVLKAIYSEDSAENTLLYHLLSKCRFADRIIVVGGYKYNDLLIFWEDRLKCVFPQVVLVKNEHFEDLASGYSLHLGIMKALEYNPDEILFVEGDLDIDYDSFEKVIKSKKSVLTFTNTPIYANKSVVLYMNGNGQYKYAFNSEHGLLTIEAPFSCIFNSGQTWKFSNIEALKKANEDFGEKEIDGTNLRIIQRYLDIISPNAIELIQLARWTNCNTRNDFMMIRKYWGSEN